MAQRYGVLPSQVLLHGDTIDYFVMDVAMAWHDYQHAKEDAKSRGLPPPAPRGLTVNKMQEMIERVRG